MPEWKENVTKVISLVKIAKKPTCPMRLLNFFSCLIKQGMNFSLLINMIMPTIVGIFIFIGREIFMRIINRTNFILNSAYITFYNFPVNGGFFLFFFVLFCFLFVCFLFVCLFVCLFVFRFVHP